MLSDDEESETEWEGRTKRSKGAAGKRRRAGRILRSACKPISISSEIRLSEFLAMRARLSDRAVRSWFIGPLLILAPRLQDSSQYPLYYYYATYPHERYQINALLFSITCLSFHALSFTFGTL